MKRFAVVGLGLLLLGSVVYRGTAQEKKEDKGVEPKVRVIPNPNFQLPGGEQPAAPGLGQMIRGPVPGTFGSTMTAAHKDLMPALLDALKDSDADVRQAAAATLVHIGREAVMPLVELLKDKDKQVRANAAYVLGQIGTPAQEAVTALAKALKDEDKEVRRRVAFALYQLVRTSQEPSMMMTPPMPGMMPGGFGAPPMPGAGRGPTSRITVNDPGLLQHTEGPEAAPAPIKK
jgi:hypothetical protein